MEVTDSTKTIVGVCFGYLYDQMYDDARRNSLVEAVGKFTQDMLMDPGIESKVSDRKLFNKLFFAHTSDPGSLKILPSGYR
jgi:hypothetical protein